MLLEQINENILRLSGDASLSDIYSRFPNYELFVEPLGSEKTISDFICSGGFGYGALREGPFNSKIFRIKWKREKYSFKYGLMDSTLYAAGYPLHRIVSSLPHNLYNKSLGDIQEIIIPVRNREPRIIIYDSRDSFDFHIPSMSRDVLFLNNKAASFFDLPGQGTITVYPSSLALESSGFDEDEFNQKRFIEDNLGEGNFLQFLTQKSGAAKLYELAGTDNVFFALSINIGLLVIVTGNNIEEKIAGIPMIYKI